jgi:ribosome assembly protein SQT1
MLNDRYGRCPLAHSRHPFTCGLTGRSYSALDLADRVEFLARSLAKEFGWQPNRGSEWDKIIGIYSFNTVSDAWLLSSSLRNRKQITSYLLARLNQTVNIYMLD